MHTSESTITLVPKPDRREQLLQQIQEEWSRSPQLRLSPLDIQNRWGLEPSTCFDLLTVLMDQRVIARSDDGMYFVAS
jgi:DNA-binding IclR family transcriptional regulator